MTNSERGPKRGSQPVGVNSSPRLAEDQFYQALASHHRRRVLYYLLEVSESTVEELATVLCGWDISPTEMMQTPADRRELLIGLSHNHVPRLADAGLINYDPETGFVQLASLHPQVADIIRQSVRAEKQDES